LRNTLLTAPPPLSQESQTLKMLHWKGILLSPPPPFAAQACSGVGKDTMYKKAVYEIPEQVE